MSAEALRKLRSLSALLFLILFAGPAAAQNSGIAGVVRDATSAVLPGVTVEASSPALIEKVRTAITDDQGRYNIVDLRPGVYTVTFTLTGFTAFKREGIELTTNFTANVNAEMKVGGVEETVIVSGDSPIVDIQNVLQQRVIDLEVIDEIPTGRTEQTLAALIPGMIISPVSNPVVQDVGGSSGDMRQILTIHGSRTTDFNEMIEGIPMNAMTNINTGGINMDTGAVQEFSYEVGGITAERTVGGVAVNIIPKEGGNRFSGSFFTNYGTKNLQSDNLDQDLIDRGLSIANRLDQNWDVNVSVGGPIKPDKVWFYGSTRYWGYDNLVAAMWHNATPFRNPPRYTADLDRQAVDDSWLASGSVRLTYQVSRVNKLALFLLDQGRCLCHQNTTATTAPEASRRARTVKDYLIQGSWSAPLTNRWLLEAAGQHYHFYQQYDPQEGVTAQTLSVVEQTTGFNFNAPQQGWFAHPSWIHNARASASYVTGSHAVKAGFTLQWGQRHYLGNTFGDLNLTVRNGVPIQVTVNATPFDYWMYLNRSLGLFAQDQWKVRRATINLGVRYDHLNSSVPEQHIPAVRFVGPRDYDAIDDVPNWHDLNLRVGLNYDLRGNGKTAIKGSIGRFVEGHTIGFAQNVNPVNTSVRTATRTWTDANQNFYPDCDFVNPVENGECGVLSNLGFGKPNVTTTYDDAIREGWGVRPYNWEANVGIQQELMPRVGVDVTYFRRWYGNFYATDNRLVTPQDYSPFEFRAPIDPRLPTSGQLLTGFYDISPEKFGRVQNFVTFADNFGEQIEHYNGVDVILTADLPRRVRVGGGLNIGRLERSTCFVVDSPQQLRNCDVKPPFQPQLKLNGSYPLPWWDIQVAGTFQSVTGIQILAPYSATNAQIAPSLGRNLASGVNGTAVLDLVEPGTLFGDRVYQVDARFTKVFRFGQRRVRTNFDFYNALNANPVLTYNNTYGPRWQQPTALLPGRLFKFSGQVDF